MWALSHPEILRLLEEHGQIGFWWHDLATDGITVSPGLARISGVPVTATRTRASMLKIIHPEDRAFFVDRMDFINAGETLRHEFRIVRADGIIRWLSSRIEMVLGHDGRPLRIVGIIADISERRRAQEAVDVDPGRPGALAEPAVLTWVADSAGQPIDYSAWYALTGMPVEHCIGEGWLDAVHPNDRDRVRIAHQAALSQASLYNVDYRIMTKEGQYRWFHARSAPVRDESGIVREWHGVLLPIDGVYRPVAGSAGNDERSALTGAQIRGARGLLDWSLAQLASMSGVSVSTIKRMEDGSEGTTRASKSDAVRRALQSGGILFRTIDGVTWISRSVLSS